MPNERWASSRALARRTRPTVVVGGRGDHPPPGRSRCRSIALVQRGSTLLLLAFVAAAGCATRPDVVLETLTPAPAAPAGGTGRAPTCRRACPRRRAAPAPRRLHRPAAAVVHAGRVGRHPAAHVGHQHGPALRRGLGRDVRLRPDVRRGAARDRRGRPRHLPPRDARRPARRGALDLPDLRRAGRDRRGHQGRGLRPLLAGVQPLHGPRHEGHRRHAQRPRRRRPRPHGHGPPPRGVAALARRRQRRAGGPPLLHLRLQRAVAAPRRAVALEPHRAAAHHRRSPPGQGRRGRVRRAVAPLGLGGPQRRDARAARPGRRPHPVGRHRPHRRPPRPRPAAHPDGERPVGRVRPRQLHLRDGQRHEVLWCGSPGRSHRPRDGHRAPRRLLRRRPAGDRADLRRPRPLRHRARARRGSSDPAVTTGLRGGLQQSLARTQKVLGDYLVPSP